jgi:glycosyltransferase involved in cell wall biosynthesis
LAEKSLNILFDLRPLQGESGFRGVGVYTRSLLYHLSQIDRENNYHLMYYQRLPRPVISLAEGFRVQDFPVPSLPPALNRLNVFYELFSLGRTIKKLNPDVIHFTSPTELNQHFDVGSLNRRSVVTFYDMTPFLLRDRTFTGRRILLWPVYRMLLSAIKKAGHVISISQNSADNLHEYLDVPREKISVILLAVPGDDENTPGLEEEAKDRQVLAGLKGRDFILYVGACSPLKNVDTVVRVLPQLRDAAGIDLQMVIAGKTHPQDRDRLMDLAREGGVEGCLSFTGYLGRKAVRELYGMCRSVVFPTLYEGFGLPALEAMDAGAPLVASRVASIPEVTGDAAILVDPLDGDAWVREIARIIKDGALSRQMREKAAARAATFSWEENARKTLDIYRSVAGR